MPFVELGNSVENGKEVACESMIETEYIAKTARMRTGFHPSAFGIHSACAAFRSLLLALNVKTKVLILLPSFIGWSAREGSGVYDPVSIGDINAQEFPESHVLASRIMNLPVHQDVQPQQLEAMVHKLRELA